MPEIGDKQLVLWRLYNNGLLHPFKTPLECVYALAGVQSQFQQFAEVSIANRCGTAIGMQQLQELYANYEILNLWGQRNTLHMYTQGDWDMLCDVYSTQYPYLRKHQQSNPSGFAALMQKVAQVCEEQGSISKEELKNITLEFDNESPYFASGIAALSGLNGQLFGFVEKPSIKRFVSYKKVKPCCWQYSPEAQDKARQQLMLRYFKYYGPATLADFCHWSGLPVGAAKTSFNSIQPELVPYVHKEREYYVHSSCVIPTISETPDNAVFLLGKFDPLFVSYRHKDWIVPKEQEKLIWRTAAWVEAVILIGTRVAGTWRHEVKGKTISFTFFPNGRITVAEKKKILAKAKSLAVFWNKQLQNVTYAE